jgi:c-di-GMP-binding flagellar brake protein YcgR
MGTTVSNASQHLDRREQPRSDPWDLITAIKSLRLAVSVSCSQRQVSGLSLLTYVDRSRGTVGADTLAGFAVIEAGDAVTLEAHVEGRQLVFSAQVAALEVREGNPGYRLEQLQLLIDEQRRASYRVRIPKGVRVRAALHSEAGEALEGEVLDISNQGFGAELPIPLEIADGITVRCQLTLPDLDLAAEAIVRHYRVSAESTRLGLQFGDLSPAVESALSRAVTQLQRLMLRRRNSP